MANKNTDSTIQPDAEAKKRQGKTGPEMRRENGEAKGKKGKEIKGEKEARRQQERRMLEMGLGENRNEKKMAKILM